MNGAAFTNLVIETFRLNGRLLAQGDKLGRDLGLTSARWQVMGALDDGPLPVAQIARNMGLTRQGVQKTVNHLHRQNLVAFRPNPNHRRARLVCLTSGGQALYAKIMARQVRWANAIGEDFAIADIQKALEIIISLTVKLAKAPS
ncbi:MAG: MarR family winged helix-turn-helix transcriptional regulator [Hyphomicrobiales bacterium]